MSLTVFFGLLGGIVVLAFLANCLAGWTRVPDVVVLMAAGMLLGPVFHLLDPSKFESVVRGLGTLALILILFEAGLDLEFRNALRHPPGGVLLAMRDIQPLDIETISLLVARGLITAVLAFEIVDAKGASFSSVPGLVFSVILWSNLLMFVAAFRHRGPATDAAAADSRQPASEPAS